MRTRKEIEKELEERRKRVLSDWIPPKNKKNQSELDYDRGFTDALEWVLGDSDSVETTC